MEIALNGSNLVGYYFFFFFFFFFWSNGRSGDIIPLYNYDSCICDLSVYLYILLYRWRMGEQNVYTTNGVVHAYQVGISNQHSIGTTIPRLISWSRGIQPIS